MAHRRRCSSHLLRHAGRTVRPLLEHDDELEQLGLELGQLWRELLAAAQLDDAPAHVEHVDDALQPARVAVGEGTEPIEARALVLVHHRRVVRVLHNAEACLGQPDLVMRL